MSSEVTSNPIKNSSSNDFNSSARGVSQTQNPLCPKIKPISNNNSQNSSKSNKKKERSSRAVEYRQFIKDSMSTNNYKEFKSVSLLFMYSIFS